MNIEVKKNITITLSEEEAKVVVDFLDSGTVKNWETSDGSNLIEDLYIALSKF